MARNMKIIAFCSTIAAVIAFILYEKFNMEGILSFAVTMGTIAYHFVIRLLVGHLVDGIMHNQADYTKKWYQIHPFEEKLYRKFNVKKWKGKMPTYNAELFSLENKTLDEIVQVTCQAEIVHEINVLISFLPLLASLKFGSFAVFLITSVLAACYDMLFVIIQRYNRPRLVRLARRQSTVKIKE